MARMILNVFANTALNNMTALIKNVERLIVYNAQDLQVLGLALVDLSLHNIKL